MTAKRLPRPARGPHLPLRVPSERAPTPEPAAEPAPEHRPPIGLDTLRAAFSAHIAHEHGDPRTWDYQRCHVCRDYLTAEWQAAIRAATQQQP